MISAVIITYNEAKKLEGCLESIRDFVDEIVLIDLGSTDNTVEIARKYDAQLFFHNWIPYADPIRNWAIAKAQWSWILMLDPDERLTEGLKRRLKEVVKTPAGEKVVAVNIPFKNIFFGHWISHTNFWPDRHIRFFKKGSVVWSERVHSYPRVKGKVLELPATPSVSVEHLGYDNRIQFIKKQWKYSTSEAWNKLSSGQHFSLKQMFWKPAREFLARFIKHQGYKDGLDGVFLVGCLMWYQVMVQLKMLWFAGKKRQRY